MAEKVTLYNESIRNGEKARWPYDTSLPLSERYNTVMNSVKQAKNGYLFEGWRYNGTIYKEPFQNEETNPFGPINEDIEIMAMWSRIFVYCVRIPNVAVPYSGGNVSVTYYAVVGNQVINTNQVTLIVDSTTDASYTRGSDSVYNSLRQCTFTVNQNSSHDIKRLVVYAQYNGINSEKLIIYQTNN